MRGVDDVTPLAGRQRRLSADSQPDLPSTAMAIAALEWVSQIADDCGIHQQSGKKPPCRVSVLDAA
jgi:hypothetical protein